MFKYTNFTIIPLNASHDSQIAQVIRSVSDEYGLTADKGFSVADPTLDCLSQVYRFPKHAYWIVLNASQQVVGGAGIAPLEDETDICELQKMYLLPHARQQGLATYLAQLCFKSALEYQFKSCYLETTACLKEALRLYKRLGFVELSHRLGHSTHDDCEICMLKNLIADQK